MRRDHEQHTLGLEDRPTVGQVIAICKQLVREDRWHRRAARAIGRLRRMDWAAWRFRHRMRLARIRNESAESVRAVLQREVNRVAAITEYLNAGRPREEHVRGKVYLPRGVFVTAKPDVPDHVDIVWPRSTQA